MDCFHHGGLIGMDRGEKLHIGTSGWNYSHWKGNFYPEDLTQEAWFEYYQRYFNTVEINNTFYQLPKEETFRRWEEQALKGFLYAVKANRYMTHMKKLKDPVEPLQNFISRVKLLKEHLGPILWQLPPRWHANPKRLEDFVCLLPTDLRHVFEFRDPDWFQERIRQILERYEMSFCIHDKSNVECPAWVTTDTVYVRFHGSEGNYSGEYGKEMLLPWADRIQGWLEGGKTVFTYFNNDPWGFAVKDARILKELL
jgi:uncharacterized protein YecE (DUF72 family)